MSYEKFADNITHGEYSIMSNEKKLKYIFETEEGMYVPQSRLNDYRWLCNNFLIHNKNHPLSNEVMKLLKKIVLNKS